MDVTVDYPAQTFPPVALKILPPLLFLVCGGCTFYERIPSFRDALVYRRLTAFLLYAWYGPKVF